MQAHSAILFHQAENTNEYRGSSHLATLHTIEMVDSYTPKIKEGQLLSHERLMQLLNHMAGLSTESGLEMLPENVLAKTADVLVWYEKAQVRPMLFKVGNRPIKLNVPWPALIFKAEGDELSVAALRYTRRPKDNDPIHYAPLMNTYADHSVCTGTAVCPDTVEIDSIPAWNEVIFDTYFTHMNDEYVKRISSDTSETTTTSLMRFWKGLKGQTRFPVRALIQDDDLTVKEWIEQ